MLTAVTPPHARFDALTGPALELLAYNAWGREPCTNGDIAYRRALGDCLIRLRRTGQDRYRLRADRAALTAEAPPRSPMAAPSTEHSLP